MKMSDVFKDSKQVGSFERIVCQTGYEDLGEFDTVEQAQAAAHAINQHDALVAMNAELVEALGNILWDVCQDDEPNVSLTYLALASGALLKAKELTQ